MAILREVHRLLSPGGYFLFSTYNRNSAEHDRLFSFPKLTMPRETRDLARRIASFCLHTTHRLVNRIRYRSRAVATAEYSIINDQSHDYCTMLYYITLDQQRRQLERVGFKPNPRVYGRDGQLVDQDDSKLGDTMLVLAQR